MSITSEQSSPPETKPADSPLKESEGNPIAVEEDGTPTGDVVLTGNALKRLNQLSINKCLVEVSLSDEKNYAIANVIIFETNENY